MTYVGTHVRTNIRNYACTHTHTTVPSVWAADHDQWWVQGLGPGPCAPVMIMKLILIMTFIATVIMTLIMMITMKMIMKMERLWKCWTTWTRRGPHVQNVEKTFNMLYMLNMLKKTFEMRKMLHRCTEFWKCWKSALEMLEMLETALIYGDLRIYIWWALGEFGATGFCQTSPPLRAQVHPPKKLVVETWNLAINRIWIYRICDLMSTWLDDTMTALIPLTAGLDNAMYRKIAVVSSHARRQEGRRILKKPCFWSRFRHLWRQEVSGPRQSCRRCM